MGEGGAGKRDKGTGRLYRECGEGLSDRSDESDRSDLSDNKGRKAMQEWRRTNRKPRCFFPVCGSFKKNSTILKIF